MRAISTLENVIDRVHQMSADYHDEIVPVSDIRFNSLEQAEVSGQEVKVLPSAQRLFANRLRVPHSYLSRCPAGLQADNLNHWMREEQSNRDTLFCRFDGMSLRAVFTERYTELDNLQVLSRMLEYGFEPSQEVHYILDGSMMVLKMPDRSKMFGLAQNDKLVPGISISNSEVGILSFTLECYIFRLACSNGLITKTAIANRFKHISTKALDQFPDVMMRVVEQSRLSESQLRFSVETRVDDPPATINTFNRQFQISQDLGDKVVQAWEVEPAYTMFGVINSYTFSAKNKDLTAEQSYKLERTGGAILSLVKPH